MGVRVVAWLSESLASPACLKPVKMHLDLQSMPGMMDPILPILLLLGHSAIVLGTLEVQAAQRMAHGTCRYKL